MALAPTLLAIGLGSCYLALGPFSRRFQAIDGLLLSVGFLLPIVSIIMAACLIGAYLSGRLERRDLRRNLYALTDRRVITWTPQSGGAGVMIQSLGRGGVEKTSRIEYPDGSGDIFFEPAPAAYVLRPSLVGVPEARRVEELARRILIDPDAPRRPA
jgi:hypothetical protein